MMPLLPSSCRVMKAIDISFATKSKISNISAVLPELEWIFDDSSDTLTNRITNYIINVPKKWSVPLNSGHLPILYVLELNGTKVIEKKFESGVTTGQNWTVHPISSCPASSPCYSFSVYGGSEYLTGLHGQALQIKSNVGKF